MGLRQTNALVSIAVNGGAATPQAANTTLSVSANSTLVFSLQSTSLIQLWDLVLQDVNNPQLTYSFQWTAGQLNAIPFSVGPSARTLSYVSAVSDGAASVATVTGFIASLAAGSSVPKFVTDLSTFAPAGGGSARQVLNLDGYRAVGDGGGGVFYWQTGTFTADGGTVIVPAGFAGIGAWVRQRVDLDAGRFNAAHFGVPVDGVSDCAAVIQAVLDLNRPTMLGELYLPNVNPTTDSNGTSQKYFTSAPLVMQDYFPIQANGVLGNSCTRVRGLSASSVVLAPLNRIAGNYNTQTWMGPLIINGMMGDTIPVFMADTYGGSAITGVMGGDRVAGQYAITGTLASTPVGTALVGSGTHFTTDLVRGMTIQIGSDPNRYQIQSIQDDTHATLSSTYFDASGTGAAIKVCPLPVFLNYSDYDCGHINGLSQLCVELFWNPFADAPAATTYVMACSYGNLEDTESHECFYIRRTSIFGSFRVDGQLITSNGTFNVATTVGHDLNANAMNHIALDYDGAHLRLWVNGAQPDGTMTVAATGTVLQKDYEEVLFGEGEPIHWPNKEGSLNLPGVHFRMGTSRLSNVSRYTSSFTPTVAAVQACDANTKLVVPFELANRSPRDSIGEWVIGRSAIGFQGDTRGTGSGIPVWMRTHTSVFPFSSDSEISNLTFVNAHGHGVLNKAALKAKIHDVVFQAVELPLTYDDYSYEATIGPNVAFEQCGHTGSCFRSWNIGLLNGAQSTKIAGVRSDNCGTNYHLVHAFADCTIDTCFISGQAQAQYAFLGVSSAVMIGGVVDDEVSAAKRAAIFFSEETGIGALHVIRGTYFVSNATTPILKIGLGGDVDFGGTAFATNNVFSFDSRKNSGIPARFTGKMQSNTLVDPSNPGPVVDARQYAPEVVDFPTDANITVTWSQISKRKYKITNSGTPLTTTRNLVIPTVVAGFTLEYINTAPQPVQIIGPSGTGVTIASGKRAIVETDGANVARVTADQ